MARVKNEHYVPQFYLKRFCPDSQRLFVFDKPRKKIFRTGIMNIACEQGFYDVPRAYRADSQVVEKAFAKFEGKAASAMRELLGEIQHKRCFEAWNSDRRMTLAFFLVLQDCRTREFRSRMTNLMKQLREQIYALHETAGGQLEERGEQVAMKAPKLEIPAEISSTEHAEFMRRPEYIQRAALALEQHIWVVGENDTTQPLFTSDAPVFRYAHDPESINGGMGFGVSGNPNWPPTVFAAHFATL